MSQDVRTTKVSESSPKPLGVKTLTEGETLKANQLFVLVSQTLRSHTASKIIWASCLILTLLILQC